MLELLPIRLQISEPMIRVGDISDEVSRDSIFQAVADNQLSLYLDKTGFYLAKAEYENALQIGLIKKKPYDCTHNKRRVT